MCGRFASTQTDAVGALLDLLEIDADEVAVLSLTASRESDGAWRLRYGSLLLGPRQMAELSWTEWDEHDRPTDHPFDLTTYGIASAQWRTFDHLEAGWRFIRCSLPASEVAGWLADLSGKGIAKVPNSPDLRASAQPPDEGPFTLYPLVNTPASLLAAMTSCPLFGWVHPLEGGASNASGELPPAEWEPVPGHSPFAATLLLLGLNVTTPVGGAPLPQGLLVGRLRRGAWIASVRGAQPNLQTFDVRIRLDPVRVSLWELVLDLEEMDASGGMLRARRIRLADIALPAHGPGDVMVNLPTLGRRVVRRLRLYDLGGRLLDAADDVHLLESLNLSLNVGGVSETTSLGDNSRPTLWHRLEALNRADREHTELLEAGLPGRVVVQGANGLAVLRNRLAPAREELLVYDSYFGTQATDWDVLSDVTVPIRLLTSMTTVPPGVAPLAPSLTCRRWVDKKNARFPFHDRGYLWEGGGVSVGTSPNGLGGRVSLIDVLEPAVVAQLAEMFEIWWKDPTLRPL